MPNFTLISLNFYVISPYSLGFNKRQFIYQKNIVYVQVFQVSECVSALVCVPSEIDSETKIRVQVVYWGTLVGDWNSEKEREGSQ